MIDTYIHTYIFWARNQTHLCSECRIGSVSMLKLARDKISCEGPEETQGRQLRTPKVGNPPTYLLQPSCTTVHTKSHVLAAGFFLRPSKPPFPPSEHVDIHSPYWAAQLLPPPMFLSLSLFLLLVLSFDSFSTHVGRKSFDIEFQSQRGITSHAMRRNLGRECQMPRFSVFLSIAN